MTFELKSLSHEAIPAALEKAHRYRLLNEPEQAESICEDVLRIDPENQDALASLILALTDRFGSPRPVPPRRVRDLLPRLRGEYERAYTHGPHANASNAQVRLSTATSRVQKIHPVSPTETVSIVVGWHRRS